MSTGAKPQTQTWRPASAWWRGAALLTVASLAAIALFHRGLVDLWNNWGTPEFSHGPLIPVISGYLFLRHLRDVEPNDGPVTDRWPGFALMLFAITLGSVGHVTGIEKLIALAIVFWVGALILISFGWRRGRQFWPPVLHLGFMLPLPLFMFWKVSTGLQLVSSEIGVHVISLMGIPVYLEGNIIDLGVYKLHVAEACSGLRYLYPVFSFTYIFAVLYRGPLWHKAVLLLAAAPVTVLMNSFRVGVIGVLVDHYGIEAAEGFLHYFEGWVVFIFCILIMLGVAKAMQMLNRDHRRLGDALDVDTTGIPAQFARIADIRASRAMLAAIAAVALTAGVLNATHREAPLADIDRTPFALFPDRVGEWVAVNRRKLEPNIADILAADDYLLTDMARPGSRMPVNLFIAWYRDQLKAGIHSPEVCIPGAGWEMSSIGETEITVPLDSGALTFSVNRAVIQKGLDQQLVYYWFDQAGRRVTSDTGAKLYMLYNSIGSRRRDGALVRFLTPIGPNEPVEAAEARLRDAIASAIPLTPRFMDTVLQPDD